MKPIGVTVGPKQGRKPELMGRGVGDVPTRASPLRRASINLIQVMKIHLKARTMNPLIDNPAQPRFAHFGRSLGSLAAQNATSLSMPSIFRRSCSISAIEPRHESGRTPSSAQPTSFWRISWESGSGSLSSDSFR